VPRPNPLHAAERVLRKYALAFSEACEEFPWGERVIKVNKRIFLAVNIHQGILRVTVKLPETGRSALALPFTAPTGYGLGKSGWVTASFDVNDRVPVDLLKEWVDESYRAIAPARLQNGPKTKTKKQSSRPRAKS